MIASFDVAAFVAATLAEDMGAGGDITSAAVIPAGARLSAVMASRDAVVVAGLPLAEAFFRALDPACRIEMLAGDGDAVAAGAALMRINGNARALLTAERSALNTVQHLTGIATLTRVYVEAIAGTGAVLLDTRKTLPGLRALEKYATRAGGATNHRLRLDDGVMIKDNHIAVAGGVEPAVRAARAAGLSGIVVEVDRIDQIEPALAAGADRLLLDNMDVPTLRAAVALVAGRVPTEASGGVRLETIRAIAQTGVTFISVGRIKTIRAIAQTGVTFISVGRITQSAPAADIGLDFG